MPDVELHTMPHRSVDMKDWEVAYNMARNVLNPDRTKLQDQYDSLLVDAHLASVMESRVLRVVRSKYRLVDTTGVAKPEMTQLLETSWFEDFLQYAAEADFRGHTLIELGQLVRPGQLRNVTRIDPRNVLPYQGVVIRRRGELTGYDFRSLPLSTYLIEVGRPEDLGILSQVAPVCIVKKYAVGSWSDFVEKFGVPARWVTTNNTDKVRHRQLQDLMENMVSSAWAILQGEEKLEIMPTPNTDAHKVFDELIARMNSEISKRILGQDGTSDNKDASGTYGSLKVLQSVAEDRHQADKARVRHVVNNELLPRLVNLGYPFSGLRFEWDEFRDLSSTELVDAVAKLGTVFEIDPQHVAERTGIKILGIKRAPGEISDNPGAGRQGGKKKQEEKKDDQPDEDEDGDGDATASWPCANPMVCGVCGGRRDPVALGDLSEQAVTALLEAAGRGEDWSNPYFTEVGMRYREGLLSTWENGLKDLDYNAPDHAAAAAMEINLFRFSAAKTTAALLDLNAILKESNGYADFKRRVDESKMLDDYNRRWLQTEYQHAVQVGVQSSRYYQHVRDVEAFPWWEYFTQGDAQVRPTHAALDRKTFQATDPIWERIYPPNGWGCRCTVLPVAFEPGKVYSEEEGLAMMRGADSKDYQRMEEGGWLVNRSKSTVVFDLNKAYVKELRGKGGFTFGVNQSYASDRMDFESIKQRGLPERAVNAKSNADALTWFDANSTDTGASRVLVVSDHMGRKVHMGREDFERHLQGKHRVDRHQTAELIPTVMGEPDEVWITQSERGKVGLSYVKFYDQGIMRVNAVPDGESFRITTWTGEWQDSERRGLLIKPHDLLK